MDEAGAAATYGATCGALRDTLLAAGLSGASVEEVAELEKDVRGVIGVRRAPTTGAASTAVKAATWRAVRVAVLF